MKVWERLGLWVVTEIPRAMAYKRRIALLCTFINKALEVFEV